MPNKEPRKVEVLVAYTKPVMWEAVQKKHIAVQKNSAADVDKIAFIRIDSRDEKGKRLPGTLTHIADVKATYSNRPVEDFCEGIPQLVELYREKGWVGTHKEYHLGEIKELPRPIPHQKGCRARSRVKFYTTLEQIKKAKVLQDIKTLSQLESKEK